MKDEIKKMANVLTLQVLLCDNPEAVDKLYDEFAEKIIAKIKS